MASGLTLGVARASLPTAALSAAKAATAALSAPDINAASSWLLSDGKWRGTVQKAVFTIYDDEQITLPRNMLTVCAAEVQGTGDNYRAHHRFNVTNEWFQWIPGGFGLTVNPPYDTATFNSLGDGFVFFRELPSAGTLRVTTTTAETANSVNFRGYDSTGAKVFTGTGGARIEGENVTLPTSAGSVNTATIWGAGSTVYAVNKPTTNGVLLVYHIASSDATATLVGRYEPGEQVPNYRRYLVPQSCIEDGQVVAQCKVAHVPVRADNDEIIPGNLNALEMALMALNFRRKAEIEKAAQYIGMAIDELNAELGDFNAEQSYGVMQIDPHFASPYNAI